MYLYLHMLNFLHKFRVSFMYHRACGMGEKSVTIEDVYIYPLAQSINYITPPLSLSTMVMAMDKPAMILELQRVPRALSTWPTIFSFEHDNLGWISPI